ncbi:hypothetical protein CPB85DRAFT_951544 [Mucidula mucida]|nr:hypothetical protein CPB85DRAFT_951544 [Mucidula mucida]
MLESMIDKAKNVYARWKMTQNVPTVYYDEDVTESRMSREELILMMSSRGPFRAAHPSLVQCQIEVVQRGKCVPPCRPYSDIATLFSNTWAPTAVHVISPVLPHSNPHARDASDDPKTSQTGTTKYPGVDTMSIELGAMNLGGESGMMAWF